MMVEPYSALLIGAAVLLLVLAYRKAVKPGHLPPGPKTWPFIGNLLMLKNVEKFHLTMFDLKRRFGPLYSLQLGWHPVIVLACPKLIREAFVHHSDVFSGRPSHLFTLRLVGMHKGIIFSNGKIWKAARKVSALSVAGIGTTRFTLEDNVQREAQSLVNEMLKKKGEPFTIGMMLNKATCNIICSLMFGEREKPDDPRYIKLNECIEVFFHLNIFRPTRWLPFLLPFNYLKPQMMKFLRSAVYLRKYLRMKLEEAKHSYKVDVMRGLVDVYLEAAESDSQGKVYADTYLFQTMIDLLLAGTETTGSTVTWALYFFIRNQDVQERCRQEILQVNGKDEILSLKNLKKMPYFDATMCEVQRLGNVSTIGAMHCTTSPVEFQGYTIPSKTIVLSDLYTSHMDPEVWDNPEEFRPERFLDSQGEVIKPPEFIPFSVGRRACVGESLARLEMFTFTAALLQHFTFTCPDLSKLPGVKDANLRLNLSLPQFEVIATPLRSD